MGKHNKTDTFPAAKEILEKTFKTKAKTMNNNNNTIEIQRILSLIPFRGKEQKTNDTRDKLMARLDIIRVFNFGL